MIFVTGATGFIGSHLIQRLSRTHALRCLVRPDSRRKLRVMNNVEWVEGSLRDSECLKRSLKNVESVIHLAALLRTAKPEAIRQTNVDGTKSLVEQAQRAGVGYFIFLSTENVLREDLCDAYAQTKREAEKIVSDFPSALILRPCFVYGPGDLHGLGRLTDWVLRCPLTPQFGGLTSQIQPLYIEDMVEYIERGLRMHSRGTYLLAGPEKIGLNDFLKKVRGMRQKSPVPLTVPRFLLSFLASACDWLIPAGSWGSSQFRNLYFSRTYAIEETNRVFGFIPRDVDAGLQSWFDQRGFSV